MDKPVNLLAIDPGSEETAYVVLRLKDAKPLVFDKIDNGELKAMVYTGGFSHPFQQVAIEFPFPRGQLASLELFRTIEFVGRLEEAFGLLAVAPPVKLMDRKDVKMTICETAKATDSMIRQAIIDRFGGTAVAIGGKKCKTCGGRGTRGRDKQPCETCKGAGMKTPEGPLFGMSQDVWQAMGIAMTWRELNYLPKPKGALR